jgi:hypothetical protein
MPVAAHNGFDGRKLADLIALLDSPMGAEATGALRRIRVLKKNHDDAPFYELIERPDYKLAVWEKFGEPECLKEQMEAAALVEKLRQDNAQLEKDGAALAQEVNRQAQIIGELRQASPVFQFDAGAAAPARDYVGGLCAFLSVMGGAALLFIAARHIIAWLCG